MNSNFVCLCVLSRIPGADCADAVSRYVEKKRGLILPPPGKMDSHFFTFQERVYIVLWNLVMRKSANSWAFASRRGLPVFTGWNAVLHMPIAMWNKMSWVCSLPLHVHFLILQMDQTECIDATINDVKVWHARRGFWMFCRQLASINKQKERKILDVIMLMWRIITKRNRVVWQVNRGESNECSWHLKICNNRSQNLEGCWESLDL